MLEEISTNSTQTNVSQNQTNISPPVQPPPNNLPAQNSKQPNFKILITLGIVVVIIILFTLGSFVFLSRQEQRTPDSLETNIDPAITEAPSPTLSPEEALRAPELYPEFEWEETSPTVPSEIPILYVDHESRSLNLSGKEWHYIDIGNSDYNYRSFSDYYGQETNKLGWDNRVEYNNKIIQALVADGPTGGVIGYAKIVGNKARIIVLDKSRNLRNNTIEYRVFVSDVFSTAELEN